MSSTLSKNTCSLPSTIINPRLIVELGFVYLTSISQCLSRVISLVIVDVYILPSPSKPSRPGFVLPPSSESFANGWNAGKNNSPVCKLTMLGLYKSISLSLAGAFVASTLSRPNWVKYSTPVGS